MAFSLLCMPLDHYYEFGRFRLLPAERLLLSQGEPIPLTAKVFDLLLLLVEHHGELLERETLMNALWPNAIVEESNLTQSVFVLRKTLGDNRNGDRFVVTVPGRGYRFIASVREFRNSVAVQARDEQRRQQLITSLAVLPLKLISTHKSPQQPLGYLGTGIADSIIAVLSRTSSLIVRPTTAILTYGEIGQDPMQAGRALKVEVVLDGTIQQVADRIRVSVQLIKVNNGTTLWAGRFDDALTDLFALQDSIAEQVAHELKLELFSAPRKPSHTEKLDVWELYLQGRYFQDKRTAEGLQKSIALAEEVIARAPDFVMGYSCLADSYNLLGEYLYLDPNEAFSRARSAVNQALTLDPASAEAHASLAEILMFYDRDWVRAEREYQTAIELNPNYAAAYHWYAWMLMLLGRFDEASQHLRLAQRIDPASLYIKTALGLPFYYQGEYDEAIWHHRQALAIDANFSAAHYYLGEALVQTGAYEEALQEFAQVNASHSQQSLALRGHTLALLGRREEAQQILQSFLTHAGQKYISPYSLALLYAGMGESETALDCLERAFQERAAWLIFLQYDPFLAGLRNESRFAALLSQVF